MPDDLHASLKAAADAAERSLHGEVLWRLRGNVGVRLRVGDEVRVAPLNAGDGVRGPVSRLVESRPVDAGVRFKPDPKPGGKS